MARLSELIVKITSDTAQFSRGVREVSVEMQRLSSASENAVRGIRTAFERIGAIGTRLTIGVSAPLAALGVAAVKADADLEALRMGLISVSGSAAAADKQLARLAEVAKLPGLGFREAIQGSVNLQAAGFSAQLAERALKAFGNALATVGRGKADLDGVILALTQIQSKGKISAQDINQLAERLPQIRAAMKAAFGTADTEALQKMGISAQEFIERIMAEFEKLPPVTGGVKNAFENIRDAAERAMAEFGAALRPGTELVTKFAEAAVSRLADLAKGFRELPPAIQATVVALGGLAVAAGPALAAIGQIGLGITGIATAIPVIKALAAAAGAGILALGQFARALVSQVVPAAGSATVALKALGGVALLAATALAAVQAAAGVVQLVSASRQLRDAQQQAREAIEQQNRSIEILRIKLHQAGISTAELDQAYRRAEISIAQYASGLMQLATAHKATHQAADEARRQTMDLAEAFRVLGVDSTETLTKRYQQARDALAAVEQAYREGKASAMDLARAQEAVRQAFEAVHKPIKAVREELGKIQGPENVGTVLRDMVSDIAGGAQAKEAEQRLRSIAEILSLRGFEPDRFPWAVANTYTAVERLGLAAQVVQRHVRSMWEAIASEDLARQAEQGIRRTAEMLGINIDQLRRLDEAKKRLGIEKERDIGQMQSDVDTVWRSDLPLRQKQRAEYELLLEKRKQGIELSKFEEERLRSLDRIFRSSAKSMESFGDAVARQVSTVLTDTGRRLSDLVFQGGKLKDVLVGSFEAFGKALLRLAIERQLANIAGAIGSIVAKLPGLSKIASVFGGGAAAAAGGGAAAATASSTAAAAGQIASQTAGTVGKVIGTSFTALAGVVTGAISAVTGIIGVFQAARQESSLNAIEWNTRKSSLHLEHIIHRINAGLPGFGDVQARIVEVRDVLIGWDEYITGGLKLAGGGGNITINMDGANFIGFRDLDAFLDELVRRLKQRGL
jgi:tape measure domain-containing protein